MVGMMQVGLGTAVLEASPLYNNGSQRVVQLDAGEQLQETNRHNREMRQRPNESGQEWHDRQNIENINHDNKVNGIGVR